MSGKPVSVPDLRLPLGTSSLLLCKTREAEGWIFMHRVSTLKYLVPNRKNGIDQKGPLEM